MSSLNNFILNEQERNQIFGMKTKEISKVKFFF